MLTDREYAEIMGQASLSLSQTHLSVPRESQSPCRIRPRTEKQVLRQADFERQGVLDPGLLQLEEFLVGGHDGCIKATHDLPRTPQNQLPSHARVRDAKNEVHCK